MQTFRATVTQKIQKKWPNSHDKNWRYFWCGLSFLGRFHLREVHKLCVGHRISQAEAENFQKKNFFPNFFRFSLLFQEFDEYGLRRRLRERLEDWFLRTFWKNWKLKKKVFFSFFFCFEILTYFKNKIILKFLIKKSLNFDQNSIKINKWAWAAGSMVLVSRAGARGDCLLRLLFSRGKQLPPTPHTLFRLSHNSARDSGGRRKNTSMTRFSAISGIKIRVWHMIRRQILWRVTKSDWFCALSSC